MSSALSISDPIYVPKEKFNFIERWALKFIVDKRDLPFLWLWAKIIFTTIPFALYLFIPGNLTWWLGLIYFAYNSIFLMGPYILMLHNTSHRRLFKNKYDWMNQIIPWVLGPFFGESPEAYFVHHIGMHHPENNLAEDLSSTMKYKRDSFLHFLHYFGSFFFLGIYDLSQYLKRKNRIKFLHRLWKGEFSFYLFCIALCFFNWQATVLVFIWPLFFTRWMMMAGNWGQHAFIDPETPANCYRNSITCINVGYNKQCFNDGYHIGHHVRPAMHWTEMPVEFQKNLQKYIDERAIVFRGVDFFMVWVCLMLKRYNWLAKCYVNLDESKPKTKEEIIALLKSRTQPIL